MRQSEKISSNPTVWSFINSCKWQLVIQLYGWSGILLYFKILNNLLLYISHFQKRNEINLRRREEKPPMSHVPSHFPNTTNKKLPNQQSPPAKSKTTLSTATHNKHTMRKEKGTKKIKKEIEKIAYLLSQQFPSRSSIRPFQYTFCFWFQDPTATYKIEREPSSQISRSIGKQQSAIVVPKKKKLNK